ncbi:hypothetical protein UlMin_027818 [Ulmus minor]
MVAQNKALKRIDHKLTQVDTKVSQMDQSLINLKNVITKLNERIQMKSLKNQLASLQSQLQQRQQATMVDPTPWIFSTLPKAPQPLPLAAPSAEPSILRLRRILEEEDKIKKEADHNSKKMQAEPKASDQFMIIHQQCLDQLPQISFNEQVQSSEEEASSSDESIPEWSTEASSQTDPEDIETPLSHFMAQTETSGQGETFVIDNDDEEMSTTPPSREAPPVPTGKFQMFTLDDLPPSKWRTRFQEFRAWTLLEAQKPRAQPRTILLQFVSRFTGILQDWWINLGEYRQIQFLQIASVELALDHIYVEFCGQEAQVTERQRAEFFKMKCYSMQQKDLEKHYREMTERFYLIGGVDDPNLKQALLSSIPDPLGEETFRLLSTSGKTLQNTTLGELYQLVLRALEKMCSQNKFIQEYMKQTKKLDKVIRKHKKNKHYDRSSKSYKFKWRFNNKKGPWKFLRRKKKFGKSSNRCYLCSMKGHFAKQCPKGKTAKLITHIQESTRISLSDNDVKSIFSVDEEITPETLCALQPYSDCSDYSDDQESFYKMTAINSVQPVPIVKMQVIPSKYSLPIKVVAFFNTGASFTIMNPDILPKEFWRKQKQYFHTVDRNIFCTELISKPIKLQFFPGCTVIHQVLGSKLPVKDLIIGFDVYTKKKGLRILPSGLAYKQYFIAWEPVPNYFQLLEDPFQH